MALKDEQDIPNIESVITLSCVDCNRELVSILLIDTPSDKTQSYQAVCPCGAVSFRQKVVGQAKIAPCGGLCIDNITNNNGTTKFILKKM